MNEDVNLMRATRQVETTLCGDLSAPCVKAFFDEPTFTASYVVHDPATKSAAIIDSVLDFDQASGRTSFASADEIIDYVNAEALQVRGCSKPTLMPIIFQRRLIYRKS